MNLVRVLLSCSLSLCCLSISAQKLAILTVHAGPYERDHSLVSLDIDALGVSLTADNIELRELRDGKSLNVPFQIENGSRSVLWWVLDGRTSAQSARIYEVWQAKNNTFNRGEVQDDGSSITMGYEGARALSYRYTKALVPEGVSIIYSRAGYIHPLFTPSGQVLTRIQPSDHYHHYGIWNPWTHTEYNGREVDFWNLNKGQGRVDVAERPIVVSGPVFSEIRSKHLHAVITDTIRNTSENALVEDLQIRVWNTGAPFWVVDHISTQQCATEEALLIKKYRYQGFGFRALAEWNDSNVELITSEGKTKKDANATRARWCKVNGPVQRARAGVVFMTNPSNYNFPELLRIWPEGANGGVENVFVNFNPAQDRDWHLIPYNSYTSRHRVIVFDGDLSDERAEILWNDYAHPAQVTIEKVNVLEGKKILVFTKNGEGFVHDNLAASVAAIEKLGAENGFEVDHSDSSSIFTSPRLDQYDAVVFSNTNNKTFDTLKEKIAFQKYIRKGGGFVGIHSATGSERSWPWYQKLVGGKFLRHPPFQRFSIEVLDKNHPSTYFLPDVWEREDECYFIHKMNPTNHVLLAARLPAIVDTKKEEYPGDTWADLVPLAWHHDFDGGRQWYTALGHAIEHYSDPVFMRHILGGIEWVCTKERSHQYHHLIEEKK